MAKKLDNASENFVELLDTDTQRALAMHTSFILRVLRAKTEQPQLKLNALDGIRAIRWITWARRHDVPLSHIVDLAFGWGNGISRGKFRRNVNLLPVSVATMTGAACYAYIQECVGEYDGTRLSDALREQMLKSVLTMPVAPMQGRLIDFPTVEAYTDAYSANVKLRRRAKDDAMEYLRTKSKPFPGNPFR